METSLLLQSTNGAVAHALTIGLIDEVRLFRDAFRSLIGRESGLEVVWDAGTPKEALAALAERQPELIIVGTWGPSDDSAGFIAECVRCAPGSKVMVMLRGGSDEATSQTRWVGASAHVSKSESASAVIAAIRRLGTASAVVARTVPAASDPLAQLSKREREVFRLLVRGQSNQMIAGSLRISGRTVETHRAHILTKLQLHSLVALVRFAARIGEALD